MRSHSLFMTQSFLLLAALFAAVPGSLEGRWVNPAQSVIMIIQPCGETFCGTVDWASEEAKEDSRKGTDQLVGAQLLSNVRQREDGRWDGRLFIPDVNRRVHAKIQLLDEAHLKVSGCALGRSLCKSQVWVRIDASSPATDGSKNWEPQ